MNYKIEYFLSSLKKRVLGGHTKCPYCKTDVSHGRTIDSKYVVTKLVECPACKMLVRLPTDDIEESKGFYQEEYTQGYTTDCPSDEELAKLIESKFVGAERDYSRYLRFFEFLKISKDKRILDFGCSWGYGLYQMVQNGYYAEGFEVSVPRAKYGKDKLGVNIHSSGDQLSGSYDVIFSSHVLEHLPDFMLINHLYQHQLKPGGCFVAITPNGSTDFMRRDYNAFHQIWGKVHPVLLTDHFLNKNFKNDLYYLDSWDSMHPEFKVREQKSVLDKFELVYVLKKSE